jgi:septal ring factor EnvC (AmiA/AmiB activator)
MSTAGKVLSVIVMLALVGWLVLASAVTQLNKEWLQAIDKLDKQIAGTEDERVTGTGGLIGQITDLENKIHKIKADTALEQAKTAQAITVLRTELSDMEKAESETKETLARMQFEVANVTAAEKLATEALALRRKEKADTEKAKADEEALVEKYKGEVGQQFAELEKLRGEFKQTLADTQRRVEQLRKRQSQSQPRTRAATYGR